MAYSTSMACTKLMLVIAATVTITLIAVTVNAVVIMNHAATAATSTNLARMIATDTALNEGREENNITNDPVKEKTSNNEICREENNVTNVPRQEKTVTMRLRAI